MLPFSRTFISSPDEQTGKQMPYRIPTIFAVLLFSYACSDPVEQSSTPKTITKEQPATSQEMQLITDSSTFEKDIAAICSCMEKTIVQSSDLEKLEQNKGNCQPLAKKLSNKYSSAKISKGMEECMKKIGPKFVEIMERTDARKANQKARLKRKDGDNIPTNHDLETESHELIPTKDDPQGLEISESPHQLTEPEKAKNTIQEIQNCIRECQSKDSSSLSSSACIQKCQ